MKKEELKNLKGKTIEKIWKEKISKEYDDKPFLFIKFTDGTLIKIISKYEGYTGNSEDEYPRFIEIKKLK